MWQRIEKQLNDQLPFVVYQKPKQSEVIAILQTDKSLNYVSDFSESGFVFAPFESKSAPVLIRKDEHLSIQFSAEPIALRNSINEVSTEWEREAYIKLVQRTIEEIASGNFKKVVLSRFLEVDDTTSIIDLFKRIASTYNNAFCYLWFHPEIGMWLGATPEILLQVDNQVLTTMSLAGTMKYDGNDSPSWGTKELDEQELVTEYIVSALDDKVTDVQKSDLQTIRAGELLHLRTKITGILKSDSLKRIIDSLHPTPAVCGFPKKATMDFILLNEGFDRAFYCGYLGELNFGSNKSTTLHVNLRCMQKEGNVVKIYIGGGVTKDSDAEKEWQETVGKSLTMLRILPDEK